MMLPLTLHQLRTAAVSASPLTVTPAPPTNSEPSHVPTLLNGPLSPPFDPHGVHGNYSSDNDDGSETDDEALQKEIKRLKEK